MTLTLATALIALFITLTCNASNIKHLVLFGDSLSYDGKLDQVLAYLHLPYEYTNGNSWSQMLSQSFDQKKIKDHNYALPGGTARFQTSDWITSLAFLNMEITYYLLDSTLKEREQSLVIIWIGYNDYLVHKKNINSQNYTAYVDNTIRTISTNIKNLINHGCMNFLIMNLGDFSKTPFFIAQRDSSKITSLISDHNSKLAAELIKLKNIYAANIYMFDVHLFLNEIIKNKADYGLKNISEACKIGEIICSNPDRYLYWDHLHFTKKIHSALANAIHEFIYANWPNMATPTKKQNTTS